MKIKKGLAVMLSVATVISGSSIGAYSTVVVAKDDKVSVTRATESLRKINWEILRENAKSNSEQTNPTGKGGLARRAFNNYEE